ncbi:MAG: branched-chain amino acid ABC transporter permease [Chloroflexota bacterium]
MRKEAERPRLPLGRGLAVGGSWRNHCIILLVLAVVLLLPVVMQDQYYLQVLCYIMLYAYLASAWNLIGGYGGQVSIGHGAFAGIGAYTTALLFIQLGVSPWFGMFVGAVLAVVVAVIIGWPCFKLRGPYFALTTLACCEIFRIYFTNTDEVLGIKLGGARGVLLPLKGDSPVDFQFTNMIPYYYIALAMLVAILVITRLIERSRLGVYLVAIRGDHDAALSLGVDNARFKLIALMVSAALTAFGGTYYAQLVHYVNPARIMGFDFSIQMVLVAVVGGPGTVLGPVLGSVLLTTVQEFARATFGSSLRGLHIVIYGVVMIVSVLFLPRGIMGFFRDRGSTSQMATEQAALES